MFEFWAWAFLNNGSKPDNSFSVDDIDKIRDEIVSQNATLESFGQTLYLFWRVEVIFYLNLGS